ncbi:MAG TPA: AmmeMemoRadiSam system protein B [Candidatus Hydrogenedentes bacterium]|nr:AmmeMemoRadiSam system protein B [Candidatus Hydrogenedentota bacterium]HOS03692.1 AmmeMemoRadiSam system protein B [Candidatus Hydrogenedentota bacterium]
MSPKSLPAMRNVEVVPFEHEGERLVCMTDPEGIIDGQLVLSQLAFFVASLLDGESSVSDIQRTAKELFDGHVIKEQDIRRVVQYLDESGFLVTENYLTIRQAVIDAYVSADARPAHLAGKTYPDAAEELREYFDALFDGRWKTAGKDSVDAPPLRCLIVPHIDYERGAEAYATAYRLLRQTPAPTTVLVFGVAHMGPPVPFTLTRKHFETPLGTLKTDSAAVDRLAAACSWDPFEYELIHRTEHSIELQAVLLAHLLGPDVKLVPVLCGDFEGENERGHAPIDAKVDRFLDECRKLVAESEGRTLVIAGADLAHVGRRFGDDFEIDEDVIRSIEKRDREDLAHVTSLDPQGFYQSVMKDVNARRVCGLNCIYSALHAVAGIASTSELAYYGSAPDPAGGIVSFADVVLH